MTFGFSLFDLRAPQNRSIDRFRIELKKRRFAQRLCIHKMCRFGGNPVDLMCWLMPRGSAATFCRQTFSPVVLRILASVLLKATSVWFSAAVWGCAARSCIFIPVFSAGFMCYLFPVASIWWSHFFCGRSHHWRRSFSHPWESLL